MAYVIRDPQIGHQPIATTSTVKNHPLGMIVTAVDPVYGEGEFVYLSGVESTAVGSWVVYDQGATVLAVADAIGPVGIAMSANVDSQYGWYQISGANAVGKALDDYEDNALVYLTSTAGSVDDTAVAGDLVHNAKGASAVGTPSAGLALFTIERPWVDNNTDDLDGS